MEEAAVAGQQVGCGFVGGALIAGSVLAVGVAVPYRRSTIAAHSSIAVGSCGMRCSLLLQCEGEAHRVATPGRVSGAAGAGRSRR